MDFLGDSFLLETLMMLEMHTLFSVALLTLFSVPFLTLIIHMAHVDDTRYV